LNGESRIPRARWAARAVDAALILVSLAVRWWAPLAACDDAYIVLAAARSALSGFGFHLLADGSDAVLTTLAWPVLVAGPLALGASPAVALAVPGVASELLLALVVRRLTQRISGSLLAAAVVSTLLVTHPVLRLASQGGMETPLFLAFGALAALALAPANTAGSPWAPALLALATGLLPWVRFDGLLPAAVFLGVGFWTWRASRQARRWLLAGALLAGLVPLGHRLIQGAWVPATIGAKALHGGEASLAAAGAVALEFARATLGMSAYWLVTPSVHALLLLASFYGAFRWWRARPLHPAALATLLWSFLHVSIFVLAGRAYATNFPWYFVPPLLGFGLLAAYGMAPMLERITARTPRMAAVVPALLVLVVGLAALPSLRSGFERLRESFTAHRERAYAAAAIWLGRSGPAASVASNEIGTLAWYSPPGTEIIDLFGLARRPAERSLDWLELVRRRRPEAVVTRMDFRYRRELEAELPGEYLWARLGALDVGLRADRAARFAPLQEELPRIYFGLELGAGAPP
jgi:hypothetical protein